MTWIGAHISIALCATWSVAQEENRKVEGLLVASGDQGFHTRLEKSFEYGMAFNKLASSLANPEIKLMPWGNRSAIVLDLRSGQVGEMQERLKLAELLATRLDQDRTFSLSALSGEDRGRIQAFFGRSLLGVGAMTDDEMKAVSVGLYSANSLNFVGPKDREISIRLPIDDKKNPARDAKLSGAGVSLPTLSDDQRSKIVEELREYSKRRNTTVIRTHGVGARFLPEGMKALADEVSRLYETLSKKADDVSLKILKQVGLEGTKPNVPTQFKELSDDLKKEAQAYFKSGYKALGFESEDEALAFLRSARISSARTELGMGVKTRRGSGPGTFVNYFLGLDGIRYP